MTKFIIDEVVLQNAHVGKDSNGHIDRISTKFILNFCESNHKLALNTPIKIKYHKLSDKLIGKKFLLNIPSLMHQLLLDKNRIEYFDHANFEFDGPKKCDKEFVKVARESKGIFVTEDGPLINIIHDQGLTPQITVKRIEEAINFL